jgi:hypothetical protein
VNRRSESVRRKIYPSAYINNNNSSGRGCSFCTSNIIDRNDAIIIRFTKRTSSYEKRRPLNQEEGIKGKSRGALNIR